MKDQPADAHEATRRAFGEVIAPFLESLPPEQRANQLARAKALLAFGRARSTVSEELLTDN